MSGIILVNKEQNYTSFDVVAIMRKLFCTKKVGHLGTLDPMAEGILPVLVGRATKLLPFLPSSKKSYTATFKFGLVSNTEDIWGNIEKINEEAPNENELAETLKKFLGKIEQIPPMYSAKKVDGVKLYTLARQGVEIKREPKKIEIYTLKYLGRDENGDFKISVTCSEGTYIRTLITDIGKSMGKHLLMTSLVRTMSHDFKIEEAKKITELKELTAEGLLQNLLISPEQALNTYRTITISEAQKIRFKNGGGLSFDRLKTGIEDEYYRIYCKETFLGLGRSDFDKQEIKAAYHNEEV